MSSNQECETCGAPAVTEFNGSPICDHCDAHVRESEEEICGPCDDCQEKEAECLFVHLDGRRFHLCVSCYYSADHEDDYLMFCECKASLCESGGVHCGRCQMKIRSWYDGIAESFPPEEDCGFSDLEEEDADEEEWNRPLVSY